MVGVFATSPVCGTSVPPPLLRRSKKAPQIRPITDLAIQQIEPHAIIVKIQKVEEAEVDDMWSVVEKKTQQRWRWQAIDHRTSKVFA
jgi:hypothetical protein